MRHSERNKVSRKIAWTIEIPKSIEFSLYRIASRVRMANLTAPNLASRGFKQNVGAAARP
jgi:hypothetical protein